MPDAYLLVTSKGCNSPQRKEHSDLQPTPRILRFGASSRGGYLQAMPFDIPFDSPFSAERLGFSSHVAGMLLPVVCWASTSSHLFFKPLRYRLGCGLLPAVTAVDSAGISLT